MSFDPFLDAFCTLQEYGTVVQTPKNIEWVAVYGGTGHEVSLYFDRKDRPVLSIDRCATHRARRIVVRSADDIIKFRQHMSKLKMTHSPETLFEGAV